MKQKDGVLLITETDNSITNKGSLLGQKAIMNCGMEAEVIEDKGYKNITVRFTDGYTSYHRERGAFIRRKISNPNIIKGSIQGVKSMMSCGMEAEVIKDNGYKNLTIRFADGTILTKKRRDAFYSGKIKNPNYDRFSIKGKVAMMNCGMEAVVIDDFGNENITVRFSDGTIREHCSRHNFEKGKIRNPNIANTYSLPQTLVYYFIRKHFPDALNNYRPDWLRNRRTLSNLEIDIWIPSKKIGIEYDGFYGHSGDTQVSQEKAVLISSANEIKKIITIYERGSIIHNSEKHINYILDYTSDYNEYSLLLKQLEETVNKILQYLGVVSKEVINDNLINSLYYNINPVEYRKVIVDNVSGIPQKKKYNFIIGHRAVMNCGMEAEVVEDNGYADITVKFADGFISRKRTRWEFRNGRINNPNIMRRSILGKEKMMKNGMRAKVIEDNGAYDIKIQFEDGFIAQCTRSAFNIGSVNNPNIIKGSLLGEKAIMNCGLEAEVIEDNGSMDITVRFADGYTKKTRRQSFRIGEIDNPNFDRHIILGRILMMNCGMEAEVIEDKGPTDITVRFKDGYTTCHRERYAFLKGKISNPNCKVISFEGRKQMMVCGMEAEVIKDNGYKNITVKFTDGTILTKQRRDTFQMGHIKNPNYDRFNIKGKVAMMNCGMEAEVLEDYGSENITVKFSDGTIREHRSRHNFIKGKIRNPNLLKKTFK